LVPYERIVESVVFESGDPAFAGEMTITWALADVGAGTEVSVLCEDIPAGVRPEIMKQARGHLCGSWLHSPSDTSRRFAGRRPGRGHVIDPEDPARMVAGEAIDISIEVIASQAHG